MAVAILTLAAAMLRTEMPLLWATTPRCRDTHSPRQDLCMWASPGRYRTQEALDLFEEVIYSFGTSMILYQTDCFIIRSLAFENISMGLHWFICCWVNFFWAQACFDPHSMEQDLGCPLEKWQLWSSSSRPDLNPGTSKPSFDAQKLLQYLLLSQTSQLSRWEGIWVAGTIGEIGH